MRIRVGVAGVTGWTGSRLSGQVALGSTAGQPSNALTDEEA
jgi:hypothetical protein